MGPGKTIISEILQPNFLGFNSANIITTNPNFCTVKNEPVNSHLKLTSALKILKSNLGIMSRQLEKEKP